MNPEQFIVHRKSIEEILSVACDHALPTLNGGHVRLLCVVDSSFGTNVQTFDVKSDDKEFDENLRQGSSCYIVRPVSNYIEFNAEVVKLDKFISRVGRQSVVIFQSTSLIAAVSIGMKAIFCDGDLDDLIGRFDNPKYSVNLAPYLRYFITIASITANWTKLSEYVDAMGPKPSDD